MLFNAPEFLFLFLPVVFLVFSVLTGTGRAAAAQGFLFLASLFFYGWWEWSALPLLLLSIGCNYALGNALLARPREKIFLWLGVVFNLGLLGYFKYAGFFLQTITGLGIAEFNIPHIALPLAISFFTFQQIAWLVDCARGRVAKTGFVRYGLFVAFFPQLIAGPIVHGREILPQLSRALSSSPMRQRLVIGLAIFFIGLFKKVVIADTLDRYAAPVFSMAADGENPGALLAWAGVLAYTFQIYFDFSGYSDMALGLARLFGIRLPVNFYSPYKAGSIIDFWRRWHMTLSRFLRDYLYIPLGGNRAGKLRRHINIFLTMLLGGLWHGAGWTFVFWGALHGIFLIINHLWRAAGLANSLARPVSVVITFSGVVLAWIFFRAESFASALLIVSAMTDLNLSGAGDIKAILFSKNSVLRHIYGTQMGNLLIPVLLASGAIAWFLPNTSEIMRLFRPHTGLPHPRRMTESIDRTRILLFRPGFLWGLALGGLATVGVLASLFQPSKVFLYFQF